MANKSNAKKMVQCPVGRGGKINNVKEIHILSAARPKEVVEWLRVVGSRNEWLVREVKMIREF